MSGKSPEYYLLHALSVLTDPEHDQSYQKCAQVLRRALLVAGLGGEIREVAICNDGYEDPVTAQFYDTLRDLVRAGFADFRGDFETPAGPRYTECRITAKGLKRLRLADTQADERQSKP
jgi:hypothetical protein